MFEKRYKEHLECFKKLYEIKDKINETGRKLGEAIKNGNKILICGNGGSAADSQHFAAEIVGRYMKERKGWPAVALTTDTSTLTAVGNDYGYDAVFERQVEALGEKNDWLIGISTSGNSENVIRAIQKAGSSDVKTIALLGRDGGKIKELSDISILLPAKDTARIQEGHIFILHIWAEMIEEIVTKVNL